jgi:cobalt-zinc-cadmium efflux system outer membrane protein
LSKLPATPSLEVLKQTLKANPAFQHFAAQQKIADSKIHLAEVENKPAWRVNTGIKHNQALGDFALSAGIEIPWSDGNRNLGQIRALHAQKLEYQTQAQALENQLSTQLLLLSHKLKHNAHVVEGLVDEIIPALEQASEQAQQAYFQGNYPYSDWYAIQQELNTAQTELIQAYSNIHLFYIELQRLTGTAQFSGSTL